MLFDAARLGRIDVLPALIQAGADVAALDPAGYSPLILSCYHGHVDAAHLFLAHGAPVDQQDGARGNTALMGAAFKGLGDIVELLLANGAQPDAANHAGQTALMFAALFGRAAIVDRLLARGADPHRPDAAGNSALSVAQSQANDLMAARLTTRSLARC
ncbi:ankyrin repeat domain-containing protein [Novosphingobium sp. PS1R-30]|uniref:Ankyrin repeat domain-containing protein n=1 Tax=Novosphingobium anseongense TaxID=3133436 RepID=A0ABU8RUF1_9SPHN